jgi:hypothetical protein
MFTELAKETRNLALRPTPSERVRNKSESRNLRAHSAFAITCAHVLTAIS